MSNGQTTGAALGDALAESANTLLSFFIRKQQIEISRKNANTQENRSNVLNDLNTLESLLKLTTPGTVLGDYPGITPILTRLAGPDGYESMKDFQIPTNEAQGANAIAAWRLALAEAYEKDATPQQLDILQERAATSLGTGKSVSIDELLVENKVARFKVSTVEAFIQTISGKNPTIQQTVDTNNIARGELGLPDLVSAINPVTGETVIFGSKESATLTTSMLNIVLTEERENAVQRRSDVAALIKQAAPEGYNLNSLEAGVIVDALEIGTVREGENKGRNALDVVAEQQPRLGPMILAIQQGQLVNQHNIKTVIRSLGPEVAPTILAAYETILEMGPLISDKSFASGMNSVFEAVNNANTVQLRQAGIIGPDEDAAPLLPEFKGRTWVYIWPRGGLGTGLKQPISTSLDAVTEDNPDPNRSELEQGFKVGTYTEAELFSVGFTFDEIQKLKDEALLEAAALGG